MSEPVKPVEPISEIVSKKKRGRPLEGGQQWRKYLSGLHWEIKTGRGQLNVHYRVMAIRIICDAKNPKLNWLCEPEGMKAGTSKGQLTILNELGKLYWNKELFLKVAEDLCENKPKTRDAVAFIRRVRLGERQPDTRQLAKEIRQTINYFWKRFPKLTLDQITLALDTVSAQVEEMKPKA
jgi:hypothetical protein